MALRETTGEKNHSRRNSGGILEREGSISISNVMPTTGIVLSRTTKVCIISGIAQLYRNYLCLEFHGSHAGYVLIHFLSSATIFDSEFIS